jgi:D-arabinose 1-dehydrogenase-like Zn-dependent alcohol dehydrogenase
MAKPSTGWNTSPTSNTEPDIFPRSFHVVTKAYGAYAADRPLEPMDIERRRPGPRDVQIEIAYCGVCHSDLHTVRSEWAGTLYPCVPGHKIVGHVTAVGAEVTIAGSLIGGIAETQEMLDFCAERGIVADIEMIPIQKIDEAYDRMQKSDVKYRFVIDNGSLAA